MWIHWEWKKVKKPKKEEILNSFVRDEAKYRQMWQTYNVSLKTIWKWIEEIEFRKNYCDKIKPREIILMMDTTYFWKKYWYMIFRAWFIKEQEGKNILWYKVNYENNYLYKNLDYYEDSERFLLSYAYFIWKKQWEII